MTQPATQQGVLGPVALADARPVRLTSFVEPRVFGIDAAVDNADNHAFTAKPGFSAQPAIVVEQFEEVEAEVGRQRSDLVLPDFENFRKIGELVSIRRAQPRGKTVETVLVAIDEFGVGARFRQHAILLRGKFRDIPLHCRVHFAEPAARRHGCPDPGCRGFLCGIAFGG